MGVKGVETRRLDGDLGKWEVGVRTRGMGRRLVGTGDEDRGGRKEETRGRDREGKWEREVRRWRPDGDKDFRRRSGTRPSKGWKLRVECTECDRVPTVM